MAQEPDAIRAEIEATRQRMGDAVEALAYKTDVKARARDKIAEVLRTFTTATESFIASVREPLDGETEEGAGMSTNNTGSTSASSQGWEDEGGLLKRNPLAVAFGAAALGFLAGLLIPSTPAENERLGPVADHVKQSARDAAQEAVGRGKAIAADAAASATAAVKETTTENAGDSGSSSTQAPPQAPPQAPRPAAVPAPPRPASRSRRSSRRRAGEKPALLALRGVRTA